MRKFIIGLTTGLFLGASVTSWAAGVFGNGYLMGWTVTTSGGGTVCEDPFIYPGTHEIECE